MTTYCRGRISKQMFCRRKSFVDDKGSETRRYFVENFPMFLSQDGDSAIATNFTYIEDDIRSLQTFTSFVQRYRPLFEALGDGFKLIFVSDSTQSFQSASEIFVRSLLSNAARARMPAACPVLSAAERWQKKSDLRNWPTRMLLTGNGDQSGIPMRNMKANTKAGNKRESCWRSEPQILAGIQGEQFETFLAVPNVVRLGASAVFETAQPSAQLPADRRPT